MALPFRLEDSIEFVENPEPRCPCVLLLDTSASMQGDPISALNEGLEAFRYELVLDPVAARRVEVAVVTFDSEVQLVQDFVTPDRFEVPLLTAQGRTHMAAAIETALDLVERRKAQYRANDIGYYRPWVFMLTDGEPQGESHAEVKRVAERVRREEKGKRVAFFAVGVEGANLARLEEIASRAPLRLRGLDFREMFVWLSRSMHAVSRSRPDERIALAPPSGWAEI